MSHYNLNKRFPKRGKSLKIVALKSIKGFSTLTFVFIFHVFLQGGSLLVHAEGEPVPNSPTTAGDRAKISGGAFSVLRAGFQTTIQCSLRASSSSEFLKIMDSNVRKSKAEIIWAGFICGMFAFGLTKLWGLVVKSSAPWPIKASLIFLAFVFHLLFYFDQSKSWANQLQSDGISLMEITSVLLQMSLVVISYWIFSNQCAAGSRVLLVYGVLFTGLGAFGLVFSIFQSGNPVYSLQTLILGLVPLVSSLLKSSKAFRKKARMSKSKLPKMLVVSLAIASLVLICGTGKDILSSPAIVLINLLVGLPLFVGSFYWALRWGDKLALRLYQGSLGVGALFALFNMASLFKTQAAFISQVEYLIYALVFMIPLALTFHSGVRTWGKYRPPVLHAS